MFMRKNVNRGEVMVDISIIVPIYNASKYLDKCIDSLVKQTKKELEFILINDGSTDDSESIIKSYSDKRIKYFKRSNHGIGKTRNFGISKSTGKYIMFLDSDDYLEKNACEVLYKTALKEHSDLLVFDFYRVENKLNSVIIKDFAPSSLEKNPKILLYINLGISNKMFGTELIKNNNIRFVENLKYEDAPFVVEALLNAQKIFKLNKKLHYYVIHDNSETTIRDERMFDIIKIVRIIRKQVEDYEWARDTIDTLSIKILVNYNIQQRNIKDKKMRNEFIDSTFDYFEKNIPNYKSNIYFKERSMLKSFIEKNKNLSKIYCSLYNNLKRIKVKKHEKN